VRSGLDVHWMSGRIVVQRDRWRVRLASGCLSSVVPRNLLQHACERSCGRDSKGHMQVEVQLPELAFVVGHIPGTNVLGLRLAVSYLMVMHIPSCRVIDTGRSNATCSSAVCRPMPSQILQPFGCDLRQHHRSFHVLEDRIVPRR
jgi:hypothetical protein